MNFELFDNLFQGGRAGRIRADRPVSFCKESAAEAEKSAAVGYSADFCGCFSGSFS